MGTMLRYGPVGAFVTPNVNDLGNPLVVKIHRQSNGAEAEEHYVNLLEDTPDVPSKREMLLMIAKDPMSQTRFFYFLLPVIHDACVGSRARGQHAPSQWAQGWDTVP